MSAFAGLILTGLLGAAPPCPDPPPSPGTMDEHLIYFAHGSAELPACPWVTAVLQNALQVSQQGYPDVRVVGRADTSGPAAYNMALSERRARAVADALVELGMPRRAITVEAYGETRPVVATGDGRPEQLNRLVVVDPRAARAP